MGKKVPRKLPITKMGCQMVESGRWQLGHVPKNSLHLNHPRSRDIAGYIRMEKDDV